MKVSATVAMPVWNAKDIAWLSMESMCKQVNVSFGWELIVFEERHVKQLHEDWFRGYQDRLEKAGCVSIKYITRKEKLTLAEKWSIMGRAADKDSKFFALWAADDYSHKYRLVDSMEAMDKGWDWFSMGSSYFYDFITDKVIVYCKVGRNGTGIQMCAATKLVRKLPMRRRARIVDFWFARNANPQNILRDKSDHWRGTLCTNGFNTISKRRDRYFIKPVFPFKASHVKLEQIVPADIVYEIRKIYYKKFFKQ